MDWLQFISSLVGSIAWPAVIVIPIIFLKNELRQLAQRVTKVSFPGGGATFADKVEQAKQKVEHITQNENGKIGAEPITDPRSEVLFEFNKLRDEISQRIATLPLTQRAQPYDFIFQQLRGLDPDLYDSYTQVQELYMVASSSKPNEIQQHDSDIFRKLCNIIRNRFTKTFSNWHDLQYDKDKL